MRDRGAWAIWGTRGSEYARMCAPPPPPPPCEVLGGGRGKLSHLLREAGGVSAVLHGPCLRRRAGAGAAGGLVAAGPSGGLGRCARCARGRGSRPHTGQQYTEPGFFVENEREGKGGRTRAGEHSPACVCVGRCPLTCAHVCVCPLCLAGCSSPP